VKKGSSQWQFGKMFELIDTGSKTEHTHMHSTSVSLLCAAKSGNNNAVSILIHLYRPFVDGLSRGFGVTRDADVQDIGQEVLLELIKVLPQFEHRGMGSLRAWLRTTVRRSASRFRRGASALEENASSEYWESAEDFNANFDDIIQNIDRSDLVRSLWEVCNQELTSQQKEIFELYVLEDLDARSVAERCRVTVNVVWLTKSRVLKLMRTYALDFYGCYPFD
jgi:RNA polymerase sigma factor (sigma-70 family)